MSDLVLLGLSGSLRKDATNTKLVYEAARLFGPADFTLGDLNLPLYDGDLEDAKGVPEAVDQLALAIKGADAVIISTPEYNKGLSGVLKNALDWVSRTPHRAWADKPVAVMSAAAGRAGGERGQAMLRQCLVAFQPRLITGPEIHLGESGDQFDVNGKLTSDRYEATLQGLMDKLRAMV